MTHYKILSVNGGGVKGLVSARIIEALVDKSGKQIHELFDYIIGTSAGGIIAVSLTVKNDDGTPKYSPKDIVKLFQDEAQRIFPPSLLDYVPPVRSLLQLFESKHSRTGIDQLFEEKLGNATFLNTTIPITTVSYSLDSDGPRLWSTYRAQNDPEGHNYFLKDAAGATSAAPTFFPPKVTKAPNGEIFHDIDGGVFANAPTMIGIAEFKKAVSFDPSDTLTVISIGTGRFKDQPSPYKPEYSESLSNIINYLPTGTGLITTLGLCLALPTNTYKIPICISSALVNFFNAYSGNGGIHWISKGNLIDIMMKGAEISDAFQSKLMCTIRINPEFDNEYADLDNSYPEHLNKLNKAINTFIIKHDVTLSKIADCLLSPSAQEKICIEAQNHAAHFSEDFYGMLMGALSPNEVSQI